MSNEQIQELSLIEQQLSSLVQQRQAYQKQILELESALKELSTTKEAYHIVGSVMIKKDSDSLKKDLEEQKKATDVRLASLKSQEDTLRTKAKILQEDIMKDLEQQN